MPLTKTMTRYAPEFVFGIVVLFGLLAARRPQVATGYFLADWHRQRVAGNMNGLRSFAVLAPNSKCVGR
jgi:hypothetical protein